MDLFELIALLENHLLSDNKTVVLSDLIDELVQNGELDPFESDELVTCFKDGN